ncbi:MAG: hypothetical protein IPM38_11435 [Ignavibacteria bacterium]|nr:hypothetical protein [Ignavibacteria bacterium]
MILQTNWCFTNSGLRDVQFIEFKIINRSSNVWEDAYFSFWTDDDLGSPFDDVIGCDTEEFRFYIMQQLMIRYMVTIRPL